MSSQPTTNQEREEIGLENFVRHISVIEYARAKPQVTTRDLVREFKISERIAQRYMSALARLGVIERHRLPMHEANRSRAPKRMVESMTRASGAKPHLRLVQQSATPTRAVALPLCLCGADESKHPTATCREFWERGL